MTQTNTINRRKALTTMGMAGAVALVTPAAALPKLTATKDQHLLDLWKPTRWRRRGPIRNGAGVEAASEACGDIRYEIATAPGTGALALAIKLAMWGWGSDMDFKSASRHDSWDAIETAAVASLYKHAVRL